MIKRGVIYSVTGRYMNGREVVAYHLLGEDGSQAQENKDRVIWLIGKGQIDNLRIQFDENNEAIIRGKGINLNKLPVYDIGKGKYHDDSNSQSVSNGVNVAKSKVADISKMGQYTIQKRIMSGKYCVGYEVTSYSGKVKRLSRQNVIDLAVQRLISNAEAQKVKDPKTGKFVLVLRGKNVDLSKLKSLVVNSSGEIIDPENAVDELDVRYIPATAGGVIRDKKENKVYQFNRGDYIVCSADCTLNVIQGAEFNQKYTESDNTKAVCDNLLDENRFTIEIFGDSRKAVDRNSVVRWGIAKPV